jgi:hypothetical protein
MALSLATLIAAALVTVWTVIVGSISVAVGVRWTRRLNCRRAERIAAQRRRSAELAAHADEQNSLVLRNDERGVYGEFPPAAI